MRFTVRDPQRMRYLHLHRCRQGQRQQEWVGARCVEPTSDGASRNCCLVIMSGLLLVAVPECASRQYKIFQFDLLRSPSAGLVPTVVHPRTTRRPATRILTSHATYESRNMGNY
ncbi:unnamed protein product [Amoebophrya sp. A25]|nr:unnamed protein product [Amoebophrya sp. A25]|eukprot:GSA25T00004350001.1